MSHKSSDYGLLLHPNIKLHRSYFKQMVKLIGINCQYRKPLSNKTFDHHGDLSTDYAEPITVGCIFQDHPDQKTLKKMGWVAELQEGASIIHVQYDLEGLQVGALFDIPSGLDGAPARTFRVISMRNIMVYPASIACEIAPEYYSADEPHLTNSYETETMPLLIDREEDD